MSMSLNILGVPSKGAARIEAEPQLLEALWFDEDESLLKELGASVTSVDYLLLCGVLEATGEDPEEPELEPSRELDYDEEYGSAGLIDPRDHERLENDTWSVVAAIDKEAGALIAKATKKKWTVFFMVS